MSLHALASLQEHTDIVERARVSVPIETYLAPPTVAEGAPEQGHTTPLLERIRHFGNNILGRFITH